MLEALKQWIPKDQVAIFWGIIIIWVSSLLFLLFSGGKLAFILFIITTIITFYLLSLAKWSGISQITCKRLHSYPMKQQKLVTGASYHVETAFKIPGFWPIPYILIRDHIDHNHLGKQVYETSFVPDFYRSGKAEYTITNLKRGIYQFKEIECSTADLLDLIRLKNILHHPGSFHVYPRTIEINNWPTVSIIKKAKRDTSILKYQKKSIEINGIREYIHGDRLSEIHWNASAKTGTLQSKEFVMESIPNILIVLDQFPSSYSSEAQFELAVSTAASIINYIIRNRLPIGLLSPGKNIRYFQPREGTSFGNQLHEHFLHVGLDGEHHIAEVISNQHIKQKQGSMIIIITPDTSKQFFIQLKALKKYKFLLNHMRIQSPSISKEDNNWKKQLQAEEITYYPISSLEQLPLALGREQL